MALDGSFSSFSLLAADILELEDLFKKDNILRNILVPFRISHYFMGDLLRK